MKVKLLTIAAILSLIILGVYFFNKQFQVVTKSNKESQEMQPNLHTASTTKVLTIIAFGDSLTAGYGVLLEESYPYLLEKRLQKEYRNIRVINMGVSGETTTAGLERVEFIVSKKPSLVLLGLGANDMLRSSSPAIAKENLVTILQRLQEKKVPVILLGMKSTTSNGKVYEEDFNAIYSSLAKEYNVPLVPFFLEGVALNPSLNISDGIHPNKEGYEKIIEKNILPVLLPVLKNSNL